MKNFVVLTILFLHYRFAFSEWKPVLQDLTLPRHHFPLESTFHGSIAQQYQPQGSDECALYKVGFQQDLYFQYVQYKIEMPVLKEFTLCMWTKFSNHSNDHPLFSYAVDGRPRAIYSWVANTERSSYYSMSVDGHTFYRLNYPLRLNRWYHSCQSWNGKTGEWQIWVNAERVGRGFHNRLVGHKIPSGGIAITGQEQTQYGGGFIEGEGAPPGSGGMLGEITMVQLYSVALTAGKAHRDHKHHHAHHYDHNGRAITTTPQPTPQPRPNQASHPLLTAGQINPNLNLNLANPQSPQLVPAQLPNGQVFNAQLLNGQFVGHLVSDQLLSTQGAQAAPSFQQNQVFGQTQGLAPQIFTPRPQQQQQFQIPQQQIPIHPSLVNPANVQFIDNAQLSAHQLFKRTNDKDEAVVKNAANVNGKFGEKIKTKRETESKKPIKRELFLAGGTLLDDSIPTDGVDGFYGGLATISDNQPVLRIQKEQDEREPAEAEVTAVMNVCGGCDPEPFAKALVFDWRSVPKKLYSGAIYSQAIPQCRLF